MDVSDDSPLPTNFEDAMKEVRALRNLLFKERMILAKRIEKAELDRRAPKGNSRSIKEAFLREMLALLKTRKIVLFPDQQFITHPVMGQVQALTEREDGFEMALDEIRSIRPT